MTAGAGATVTDSGLRPAVMDDAAVLFEWVNRDEVRSVSLGDGSPIAWEAHLGWLRNRLADHRSLMLMAEQAGAPVGYVRFQDKGEGPEAAIYLVPEARGHGMATRWLRQGSEQAARRWPGRPVMARIRRDNVASRRLFARCGYVLEGQRPDHLILRYTDACVASDR